LVKGFKDSDGKFRPTDDRTAFPSQMSSEGLLPKEESKQEEEMQSKRRGEFAKQKVKQAGGLLKRGGSGAKRKLEEKRERDIEKKKQEKKSRQALDTEIDEIIDDRSSTDSRKNRLLIRFAQENRKELNKTQRKLIGDSNRILEARIERQLEKERGSTSQQNIPSAPSSTTAPINTSAIPQTTTPTPNLGRKTALTQEQFNKLPENIKVQIRLAGV